MKKQQKQQQRKDPLSSKKATAARAVVDAFLPPLTPPTTPHTATHKQFWEDRLSANPALIQRLLSTADERIDKTLSHLATPFGTSLLAGHGTLYALADWPVPERTALMQQQLVGGKRRTVDELRHWISQSLEPLLVYPDMEDPDDDSVTQTALQAASVIEPAPGYDVVIIGTTPSAWVAASLATAAGCTVLVLDEDTQTPATTRDGRVRFVSSTVERSSLLPIPAFCRHELMQTHGLKVFGEPYLAAWNEVLHRVVTVWDGASSSQENDQGEHETTASKSSDDVLLAACKAASVQWEAVEPVAFQDEQAVEPVVESRQYASGRISPEVFCHHALENGVHFLPKCQLCKVLTKASTTHNSRVASGVTLRTTEGRKVSLQARRAVIFAGGALQSPALINKCVGTSSKHLGRHLKLQPMAVVTGFGKGLRPGTAPLSSRCTEFEYGPQQNGYGASIESPRFSTAARLASLAWNDPTIYKDQLLRLDKSWPLLVVQRDMTEGQIRVSSSSNRRRRQRQVEVEYNIEDRDLESLSDGVRGATQLLSLYGLDEQQCPTGKTPQDAFAYQLMSNHPTGTCRMSASPQTGVVGQNGEVWDCQNCFVMDASILPTPPGVDPTLITMSLAWMLTAKLLAKWRREEMVATTVAIVDEPVPVKRDLPGMPVVDFMIRSILGIIILGLLVSAWLFDWPWWLANYEA